MRDVQKVDERPVQCLRPSVRRRSVDRNPKRIACSSVVTTLAPSSVQALPSLIGVPAAYHHEMNGELLYGLCAELTRRGFGSPAIWSVCGGSAVRFAEESIQNGLDPGAMELLKQHVEYHLTISDSLDRYGSTLVQQRLAVSIECGGSGYLRLGKALAWLEEREAGLAEAFYWVLLWSLYPVMRVYDHADAERYEEGMREYLEDEPDGTQPVEFPEVRKAMPPFLRSSVERGEIRSFLTRLRRHSDIGWVKKLLLIHRLARLRVRTCEELIEAGQYDSPPLPCVLIAFEDNDAVVACFDEEAQSMLEGSSEPALLVAFRVGDRVETEHAFRAVCRFVALNRELFGLADDIASWEKHDANARIHRTEPALRT